MRRAWSSLAVALLVMATRASAQPRVGERAPEIDLRTLSGAPFQLSTLKGRPVVVTFWGSWCPPCRAEFPELMAALLRHGSAGLAIVAVNQRDQELSTKDVQRFVDEMGVGFPVLLDVRGRSRRNYRLLGLPTTVFIDTAGVVRRAISGPTSRDQLAAGLLTIGVGRP